MARINSGISPRYLSDQHLIAESVEITMITGALRRDKYVIKGSVPEQYCLGKGHINFFKPKIMYLAKRLLEVNAEMKLRGFNPGTSIDITEFPNTISWEPKFRDSCLVRSRIKDRLLNPLKANASFHRYYGKPIENLVEFTDTMLKSKLYYV